MAKYKVDFIYHSEFNTQCCIQTYKALQLIFKQLGICEQFFKSEVVKVGYLWGKDNHIYIRNSNNVEIMKLYFTKELCGEFYGQDTQPSHPRIEEMEYAVQEVVDKSIEIIDIELSKTDKFLEYKLAKLGL